MATKKQVTKKAKAPAKKTTAKKTAAKKPAKAASKSAKKSAKRPIAAKSKKPAAKKASKPAKGKPIKLRLDAVGDIPAWSIADEADRAFEVVYQPGKLRPLAKPKAVLEGHSQFTQGLAFSPDGKFLVTASEDGTVKIWDLKDTSNVTCLKTSSDHDSAVNCVSFTRDGKHLLSSSDDRTVKVWSVPDFEVVATLGGHTDYVSKVFPAGPGRCVSCSKDGTLRLWDIASEDSVHTMEQGGWVTCVGTSHDGKWAIAGNDRNVIRQWNLETGEVERVLLDASGDYMGDVMGFTLAAENRTGVGHGHAPKQIVFAPGDATFISSESDLIEWDAATGSELGRMDGDGWPLAGIAYIPDRASTLRTHADETERAFVEQLEKSPDDKGVRTVYGDWLEERGRLTEANSVRRHGAFRYVFAGTNGSVHVLDLAMRAIVASASWDHGDVHNVTVSADGRLAASGSADGMVALWEIDAILAAGMPDRHLSRPREMAVSRDGIVMTSTSDRTVRLWNTNGTKSERLAPPDSLFPAIAISPDGANALVMSEPGKLQMFDARTGEARGGALFDEETNHKPFLKHVFLDDQRLLVGSSSGPLAIWSLDPPAKPTPFEGEAGQITALEIRGDVVLTGEYASGDEPLRLKFWSIEQKKLTRELVFKATASQYPTAIALVDVDDEMRIVFLTSEGGFVVADLDGTIEHSLKLTDDYNDGIAVLPDAKVVVGFRPTLVDVRTGKILGRIQWPDDHNTTYITNTPRAIVRSPTGISLVDFGAATRSAETPLDTSQAVPSSDGAYVVASPANEELAGAPILLASDPVTS